jgi:hypothetical protein
VGGAIVTSWYVRYTLPFAADADTRILAAAAEVFIFREDAAKKYIAVKRETLAENTALLLLLSL